MDRSRDLTSADPARSRRILRWVALGGVLAFAASCALFKTADTPRSGWNEEAWGPVLPHGSFPAECELCHVTNTWTEIKPDFVFDHEAETGVALLGAHADGACLRCHNDRGPVQQFAQLGCRGCHVDPHEGALGDRCASCGGGLPRSGNRTRKVTRLTLPPTGRGAIRAINSCWSTGNAASLSLYWLN